MVWGMWKTRVEKTEGEWRTIELNLEFCYPNTPLHYIGLKDSAMECESWIVNCYEYDDWENEYIWVWRYTHCTYVQYVLVRYKYACYSEPLIIICDGPS